MNGFTKKADVERALTEPGRQMALRDADPVTVLCCGASALCVVGALSRRTLDVDAVGMIDAEGRIVASEDFSPEMDAAITAAGLSLSLNPGWFNMAASPILARGLPPGAIERSAKHSADFGPCLTVRFMDRLDLIALKMSAALDPLEGRRHIEDLVAIDPTRGELKHGADWVATWPSGPSFRQAFYRLLEGFDAADLYRE
ncbi:MAG: hypothetical protein FGM15_06495 [Chthoniobacterales bacterium]|nr:hypothetical protein [Chthoniobacterales bacterium]